MKKLVFTLGLCLVAVVCFGQKKAVTDALRLAKDATKPNFEEARKKIKPALEHPETKDDPKTWYSAGLIENLQFDFENTKIVLGQQPDEQAMYNALVEIFPYFVKAYELDLLPDAKGKVKPKYHKDMKSIMKVNKIYYMNGGGFNMEHENWKKAYDFFNQYIDIVESRLMKDGEPANAIAQVDSSYICGFFYAAAMAMQFDEDKTIAIKALQRAAQVDYKQNEVYLSLAYCYLERNDMENYEKTLNDGLALFPTENEILLRLVNLYVESEKNEKALEYALKAIQIDPSSAQLYNVAGFLYERLKEIDKAETNFLKSIELNSEDPDSQSSLGRIYFNQGAEQLDRALEIADVKKYNEERDKAKIYFIKALPYYEKSFKLNPDPIETKIALKGIYYELDMGDKLAEISKLLGEDE